MKVKDLRRTLSLSATRSMAELDNLLCTIDEADISELVAAIGPAVGRLKATLDNRRLQRRQSDAAVEGFVQELQRARDDNSLFEAIIERIKSSRAIKIDEATAIATKFMGEQKAFKSKPEAVKAILKRQIGDKRARQRKDRASEIF